MKDKNIFRSILEKFLYIGFTVQIGFGIAWIIKNIGYVQLVPIGEGKWEIGYHIAKAFTGKGYATEAVKAFLPVMSEKFGTNEVYGIRLKENAASGRVLEKCGFETFFTGEGAYHDGVYEICKSVWKA